MIAVILLILVGVVFLVLPKFRKEAAPEKPETIKVEAAEKSYAAGSRISEKNFRVYGISGKQKQLLDADTYSVSPAKVPAHGHSVTVEVSSKAYPDIKAEITVLIDRDESVRYKIGRENPDDVEAILYSNGDLEITGKGSVRNFKSDSAPWKKDSVQRLTWIDPEAEVETWPVLGLTFLIMAMGIAIPFTSFGLSIGLEPLPLSYFPWLVLILVSYCVLTQFMKSWYIRRFSKWL